MLYRITFIVMLCLSVAVIVARVLGGAEHNIFVDLLTNPDGSLCNEPCLFGIHPGMTLDQAATLLKQHPLTSQFTQNTVSAIGASRRIVQFTVPSGIIYITVDNKQQIICTLLSLTSQDDSPLASVARHITLADTLSLWGTPSAINLSNPLIRDLDYYRTGQNVAFTTKHTHRLSLQDPIHFVGFSAADGCYITPPMGIRWLGFTTFHRYVQSARR